MPMPWNVPKESADPFADELAEYLRRRGERTQNEIDRTRKTCIEFAQFLGKDIHDATSKDYTTFKRRHVATVQDEDAYQQMLDDIKSFCNSTQRRTSSPAQPQNADRRKVSTSQLSPEEIMAFLMSPAGKSADPDAPTPAPGAGDPNTTRLRPKRGNSNPATDFGNAATPFPAQSNDLHVKDLFDDADIPAESGTRARGAFAPPAANPANIPANFLGGERIDDNNFSAFFSPVSKDDDRKFEFRDEEEDNFYGDNQSDGISSGAGRDDSIARQVASNDMSSEFLTDGAKPANNELLRGVSGIDYDFNPSNLEIMRKGERNKARQDAGGDAPIDESLVCSNFRPYTVDGKYLIDIPTPEPQEYKPYPQNFVSRWLMPAIPALVGLALVCLGFAISSAVGIVFLIPAAAVVIASLPIILPPSRQTPVAAAFSFFIARSMRANAVGLDLFATPGGSGDEVDFMTIVRSSDPDIVTDWKTTIKSRLKPKRDINVRVVAGSEVLNSVVLLCTRDDVYWLLPLVRINNAWYITSFDLPIHKVASESSSES